MRTRFLMLKPSRPKTAGFHELLWDFRAGKCLVKVLYICVYWASVLQRGKIYSKSKKKKLKSTISNCSSFGDVLYLYFAFHNNQSFLSQTQRRSEFNLTLSKRGGGVQTLTNLGHSHKVLKANTLDVLKYQHIG